jgi:uncharacterized radical SAM superfamily Fe-S cluster-containing enzyme
LSCPICLRAPGGPGLSPEEFREALERLAGYEGGLSLLNLSGGEPTLHPRFEEFLRIAAEMGVAQATVSTNGLRLMRDKAMRELFIETRTVAALQFDGLAPETYIRLRGRDLSKEKLEAIEIFEKEGLPYSLTAVAARGINDFEIPAVVDLFFELSALSLMFQPAAIVGRARGLFPPEARLALDEVVAAVESARVPAPGDMAPVACSHPGCAASAYYFKAGNGRFLSMRRLLGEDGYLKATANRSFPGVDPEGHQVIKDKIYDLWAASSGGPEDKRLMELARGFFKRFEGRPFTAAEAFDAGREAVKSVFVHGLMDPESFDLSRLVKCCNHYLQAGGRLVPMCARNLRPWLYG